MCFILRLFGDQIVCSTKGSWINCSESWFILQFATIAGVWSASWVWVWSGVGCRPLQVPIRFLEAIRLPNIEKQKYDLMIENQICVAEWKRLNLKQSRLAGRHDDAAQAELDAGEQWTERRQNAFWLRRVIGAHHPEPTCQVCGDQHGVQTYLYYVRFSIIFDSCIKFLSSYSAAIVSSKHKFNTFQVGGGSGALVRELLPAAGRHDHSSNVRRHIAEDLWRQASCRMVSLPDAQSFCSAQGWTRTNCFDF